MTLRNKLLLAQAPLAATLLIVGLLSYRAVQGMGVVSQSILKDNYRSVLAAQRMKDAAARLDADAVRLSLGVPARDAAASDVDERRFESRAAGPGGQHHRGGRSGGDAHGLRKALGRLPKRPWKSSGTTFRARPPIEKDLHAALARARVRWPAADDVFALNMDAMVRKNDEVHRRVARNRNCWWWSSS